MTTNYRCTGCGKVFRQANTVDVIPCPWCRSDSSREGSTLFATRHYVFVAKALNDLYHESAYFKGVVPKVALKLSEHFKEDNPRFDDEHFLAAVAEEQ